MKIMQPKKGPAWANEDLANPPAAPESLTLDEDKPQGELSDLEWMRQRISKQVDQDDKVFEQSDDESPVDTRVSFPISSSFLHLNLF